VGQLSRPEPQGRTRKPSQLSRYRRRR
jgi:hypothetical protein